MDANNDRRENVELLQIGSISLPEGQLNDTSSSDNRLLEEEDGRRADSEYEERIVAFVDILGFKEIIRKSAGEQADSGLVARIHQALDGIRSPVLSEIFCTFVGITAPEDGFKERIHTFSDFMVMSVPEDIEALGLLTYAIFKKCRELLVAGFTSRGGIAKGKLFHRDGGTDTSPQIFGPAFLDAYNLESTHAENPRIILQNEVWDIIRDYSGRQNTRLSKFLEAHVKRAPDGPAYIDLFADFKENSFYNSVPEIESDINRIYEHIGTSLDKSADRPRDFKKNAHLARLFNAALEDSQYQRFQITSSRLPST